MVIHCQHCGRALEPIEGFDEIGCPDDTCNFWAPKGQPGLSDEEVQAGYSVFNAEGTLELQRFDELNRFLTDTEAAIYCKMRARLGDPYANRMLYRLFCDYIKNNGRGRRGMPHDMDFFGLWGYDN